MESHKEAESGLASIAESRKLVAAIVVTPWWYHPVLGLLAGGLVAAQSVRPSWAAAALDIGALAGMGVLAGVYVRQTGVWPAVKWRGATGRVRLALVGSYFGVYGAGLAVERGAGVRGALAVAALVIFGLTVVLGRRFDDRLRAELRGGE